jgi:biopolymer transport protein ExbD
VAGNNFDENEGFNDINITPFVDVVLVLLVIFMVTAPVMVKESLKVQLPKSLSSEPREKKETYSLTITSAGQFLFNGQVTEAVQFEKDLLELAKGKGTDLHFLLAADADSKHRDIVLAIDLLKRAGFHSYALQIEKIKKRE